MKVCIDYMPFEQKVIVCTTYKYMFTVLVGGTIKLFYSWGCMNQKCLGSTAISQIKMPQRMEILEYQIHPT